MAAGGDREAFNARRGARLQNEGRDPEWNAFTARLGQVAYGAWQQSEGGRRAYVATKKALVTGEHEAQYEDDEYYVKVKGDYSINQDCWTTSVLVIPRNQTGGGHWHVVFDDRGNIIHNDWRESGGH